MSDGLRISVECNLFDVKASRSNSECRCLTVSCRLEPVGGALVSVRHQQCMTFAVAVSSFGRDYGLQPSACGMFSAGDAKPPSMLSLVKHQQKECGAVVRSEPTDLLFGFYELELSGRTLCNSRQYNSLPSVGVAQVYARHGL